MANHQVVNICDAHEAVLFLTQKQPLKKNAGIW